MNQYFELSDEHEYSIYDFMQENHLKETGLNKFIPLPSEIG
jgi:hypothetical protein